MTSASTLQVAPIPVSLENAGEWSAIAAQIASEAGLPTQVTPEMLTGMIASAVALLFKADSAKDTAILRGTFAEAVIAQCQRYAGCLRAQLPLSASLNLVGARMVEGHPV